MFAIFTDCVGSDPAARLDGDFKVEDEIVCRCFVPCDALQHAITRDDFQSVGKANRLVASCSGVDFQPVTDLRLQCATGNLAIDRKEQSGPVADEGVSLSQACEPGVDIKFLASGENIGTAFTNRRSPGDVTAGGGGQTKSQVQIVVVVGSINLGEL